MCVFRRKGPVVSVQTDHPFRRKRTGPQGWRRHAYSVVRSGTRWAWLVSRVSFQIRRRGCGKCGQPRGLSKAGGQAGRIAGGPTLPGEGRGRDLPGLSTGRHFPQPFVVLRGGSERQRRRPGAKRRQPRVDHDVGVVAVTRSERATGSSQCGQGAPGPSRRQNTPQLSQRWVPR